MQWHSAGMRKSRPRQAEWQTLPEALQTALAQQAMRQASIIIADQAELFAAQFVAGGLADRGAGDGLRLFAALLRETSVAALAPVGSA